jgi:hypothetical protein
MDVLRAHASDLLETARAIDWRRVGWITVFLWVLFNQGLFER